PRRRGMGPARRVHIMMSRGEEFLYRIRDGLAAEERRDATLNLIASQNVVSPAARAALASTLGQRSHIGGRHVDQVESAMLEAAQTLYGTRNVEYRLMSGSLANQMAIVSAIPLGATVLVMPRSASGDKSVQAHGYLRWIGARVVD